MAEYIDRKVTENAIREIMPTISTPDGADIRDDLILAAQEMCVDVLKAVSDIPAADVVEVVRCKDCKFCDDAYCNDGRKLKDLYYCNWFGSVVEKDDFCSYGAKMDLEESK